MEAHELETFQIGDKLYVTVQNAANYLGISTSWLEDMILDSKVAASRIESRWLIELETLMVLAEQRSKTKRSAWDKLDEWRE